MENELIYSLGRPRKKDSVSFDFLCDRVAAL